MEANTKICGRCNQLLSYSSFYNQCNTKDKKSNYCKDSEVTRRTVATLYNYSKAYRKQGYKGFKSDIPLVDTAY